MVRDNGDMVLVRPSEPVTPSIARVFIDGVTVRIFFPEKRDDYNAVIKHRLHYRWQRPYRVREFTETTVNDRAAEAVQQLLAGGFCVKAPQDIIEMALAGGFDPEPRRWVEAVSGGEYEGWFSIGWIRDEDLYSAAKRLPGSRYAAPFVVVPSEQFEAVLDFADIYQCRVSDTAHELAELARTEQESAIVVDAASLPGKRAPELPPVNGRPPKLDMPEHVGIDDDLADDD